MRFPLVSVIIPNYNGKKFLGQCLDSVLASQYANLEIVVVDNASTDGSEPYLKRNYGQNKKIKIIRSNAQRYFTGGCNLGAQNSTGEKLIFLNSDTAVDPNWIRRLMELNQEHQKWIIQPKILKFAPKKTIDNVGGCYNFFGFGFNKGHGEKDVGQYDKNEKLAYASGTVFMIDKKFFDELGGFDEWYKYHYEDVDLNLRAKKQGGESWYCWKSVVYHKGSLTIKKNVSTNELLFNIRKNRLRTVIKNSGGAGLCLKAGGLIFSSCLLGDKLISLSAIRMVFNLEIKLLVEHFRLLELKSFLGRRQFTLLDVGCGEGTFLAAAKKAGLEAWGADPCPAYRPPIIPSSLEKLKLNKKFDVVSLYHVLEHLKDPRLALAKIASFLKKDGVLVIEVPLVGNLTEKFLQKDYFAYDDKTHRHFFSEKELVALLEKSGFTLQKKGATWFEFPVTLITRSFRKGCRRGLMGLFFFLSFKILSLLGLNDEIIRLYCRHSQSLPKYLKA